MCIHLKAVEDYIKQQGIVEYWRGQPWTRNCREWIYFECVFSPTQLKAKLGLDACVDIHIYNDIKAGSEQGLICNECKDGVMGLHPESSLASARPLVH
jgi:hypothetical protein